MKKGLSAELKFLFPVSFILLVIVVVADVDVDDVSLAQDLRKFKWYRPDLPRQDVAQALKGQPPGTFYVRESSSQPGEAEGRKTTVEGKGRKPWLLRLTLPVWLLAGCYALAMSVGGDKPWNGLITPTVDGAGCTRFRLFVAKKFESLPELITFYCSHAVTTDGDGKEVCLRVD